MTVCAKIRKQIVYEKSGETLNKNAKTNLIGTALSLAGGICWGFSGACGQYIFTHSEITAKWLVPVRLTCAGVAMLIVLLIKSPQETVKLWKNKRDVIDILIFGILGIMLCQYTYFVTIQYSSAGTGTILQYTYPVMIMVIVCLSSKKLPRPVEIIALVLDIAGVFIVATHGNLAELAISEKALVYGLCSGAACVVFTMQPKRLNSRHPAHVTIAWAMLIGGLILAIIFKPWTYKVELRADMILPMLGVVFLGSIAAFSLYMYGVKLIGPTRASLCSSVEPVTAGLLSSLWLGNKFAPLDIVGFVLILSTVVILTVVKKDTAAA